jgi:L-seryl-tRNA(Ser) seleniumtransferase
VQESVQAGAALVTFSGDKLLGGPQGGIVVGQRDLIEKLRQHPLARAMRADKVALAGLHATLLHYARGEAPQEIPVWQMIAMPADDIRRRAERWSAALGRGTAIAARSTVGGGSLPEETLPTFALALEVEQVDELAAQLRRSTPPVITRIEAGRLLLDPRTVLPGQDDALLDVLRRGLTGR